MSAGCQTKSELYNNGSMQNDKCTKTSISRRSTSSRECGGGLDCSQLVPPLDEITLCSSNDDDDSSSVSSMEGDTMEEKQPRSIFREYWKQEGKASDADCDSRQCSTAQVDDSYRACNHANYYERVLQLREKEVETQPSTRRRIFGNLACSKSSPLLAMAELLPGGISISKAKSAPAILPGQPGKSCLRSVDKATRSSNGSEHSVSFSPKIQVVLFQPPSEQWAAEGWSAFFA